MQYSSNKNHYIVIIILLIGSIACNAPFGLDLSRGEAETGGTLQVQLPTETPTPTITPTSTNTATPTDTPEPTPTSTLVVPYTTTPTAVQVDSGADSPATGAQPVGQPGEPDQPGNGEPSQVPIVGPAPIVVSNADVIVNGNFEDPSWSIGQPVAPGWSPFDNGEAHFGWYDDTWSKVVYDGEHAQLIEIIANEGEIHRYAGIYQTVDVVPGATYELTIHGLVRSDEGNGEASDYGHVLQYGIDYAGGNDWQVVQDWVDLPFPEHPREDPNATNIYNYGEFKTDIMPPGKKLTLYIRAWKKWVHSTNEGNYDVDAISLRGKMVVQPLPETGDIEPRSSLPTSVYILSLIFMAILLTGATVSRRI